MADTGYLNLRELEALHPGARVIDADGDTLERLKDGRWRVISVPVGTDTSAIGDVWPASVLRARTCWTRS